MKKHKNEYCFPFGIGKIIPINSPIADFYFKIYDFKLHIRYIIRTLRDKNHYWVSQDTGEVFNTLAEAIFTQITTYNLAKTAYRKAGIKFSPIKQFYFKLYP